MTANREPDPAAPPVRRFNDPTYVAQAETLAQLRERIDALDERIVELLAQRARLVKDATRFKRDAFQVAAPQRQAAVFARVRSIAARHSTGIDAFPDVVEAAYRALVAGFVAGERRLFDQTETLEEKDK
ncbi:MAG TPA: chorismate mutase [Burkholderiaceae bacterium]|nr:chorismate mutase [Burkholderiaceae bacterium]